MTKKLLLSYQRRRTISSFLFSIWYFHLLIIRNEKFLQQFISIILSHPLYNYLFKSIVNVHFCYFNSNFRIDMLTFFNRYRELSRLSLFHSVHSIRCNALPIYHMVQHISKPFSHLRNKSYKIQDK